MTQLSDFLAVRDASAQVFAARFPIEQPGSLGNWSARVEYCRVWDTAITPHNPHGRIEIEPHGFLRIELADIQGWKPFIAIGGMDAGRGLQGTIAYGHDGSSTLMTSGQAQWDPNMTLYEMIGATSNGTLAAAGLSSSILVAALDGAAWNIDHAFVGWTQIP